MDPSTHRYQRHQPAGPQELSDMCATMEGREGTVAIGSKRFFLGGLFSIKRTTRVGFSHFFFTSLWCHPWRFTECKHFHLLITTCKAAICKVLRFNRDLQANKNKFKNNNKQQKGTSYIRQKMRIVEQCALSVTKKKTGSLESES